MDDIKLFTKMKAKWRPWQTIRIYNHDIEIGFVTEICAMLMMKSGKREAAERIRPIEKKVNYKYLGILEADTLK